MGKPAYSYDLSFYLEHVYMIGGETHVGRLPGLAGRVTLSRGDVFPCENQGGITHLSGVKFIGDISKPAKFKPDNMPSRGYKPGEPIYKISKLKTIFKVAARLQAKAASFKPRA